MSDTDIFLDNHVEFIEIFDYTKREYLDVRYRHFWTIMLNLSKYITRAIPFNIPPPLWMSFENF